MIITVFNLTVNNFMECKQALTNLRKYYYNFSKK